MIRGFDKASVTRHQPLGFEAQLASEAQWTNHRILETWAGLSAFVCYAAIPGPSKAHQATGLCNVDFEPFQGNVRLKRSNLAASNFLRRAPGTKFRAYISGSSNGSESN